MKGVTSQVIDFSALSNGLPSTILVRIFKGQYFERWDQELFILSSLKKTKPGTIIHSFILMF